MNGDEFDTEAFIDERLRRRATFDAGAYRLRCKNPHCPSDWHGLPTISCKGSQHWDSYVRTPEDDAEDDVKAAQLSAQHMAWRGMGLPFGGLGGDSDGED